MFRKKKIIKNCPYGKLLNLSDEQKKYNELYFMKKNSSFKTYSEWSEYILKKWENDNHINNFIGLKHYLILLKNNAEELKSVPIDMISFIFGGVLGGCFLNSKTFLEQIAFMALFFIIEIVIIIIKYCNRREICLYNDLIDLADFRINQIKEQNLVQEEDKQCPTLNTKKS